MGLLPQMGPIFVKGENPLLLVRKTMEEKITNVAQRVKEARDAFFIEGMAIEDDFPEDDFAYGMNCAQ